MTYNREYHWQKRTITKDTTTGQQKETFANAGTLWGSCKPVSASKKLAYGVMNSEVDYEIHLRQYPNVDAKDRLFDTLFSHTLVISGVMQDAEKNETVVYAAKIPTVEVSSA